MDQEAFFTSPLRDYVTLADMARDLRVSISLVRRLLEHNGIRYERRHGVVRLWKRADLEALRKLVESTIATT